MIENVEYQISRHYSPFTNLVLKFSELVFILVVEYISSVLIVSYATAEYLYFTCTYELCILKQVC